MGRHRRHPTDSNNVKKPTSFTDTEKIHEQAEKRLGLDKQVCARCDANNSETADKCRKCGGTNLRPKARDYRDSR